MFQVDYICTIINLIKYIMRNQKLDLTDHPVDIMQVENGFRLRVNPNQCSAQTNEFVFQSQAELFGFLSQHFSFERLQRIENDSKAITATFEIKDLK